MALSPETPEMGGPFRGPHAHHEEKNEQNNPKLPFLFKEGHREEKENNMLLYRLESSIPVIYIYISVFFWFYPDGCSLKNARTDENGSAKKPLLTRSPLSPSQLPPIRNVYFLMIFSLDMPSARLPSDAK
ncbi:uncharacterized protein TM35_000022260 [Trypanosoma theileri]|uniref:Uncharacterized protein n=1 Tax=Trypanosoma theileri TaxID=67003 RepID=A0A1X0P8X1_9TRYP|nr:uncharacterized protein TM35_000022260 [Trypanosoma theileri]ORC92900.1 hypothetical protein TM35_000022260 [Trypanosoma theileri]